ISILLFACLVGFLLYLSASLTVAILVPIPFIVLWMWFVWKKLRRAQDTHSSCLARLSTQISESLNVIRVVKAFCQEEEEYKRFAELNNRVRITSADTERWSLASFTVVFFLMNCALILVWYIGGKQVLNGGLTLGSVLAAGSFLWIIYWPLQWGGEVSNSL